MLSKTQAHQWDTNKTGFPSTNAEAGFGATKSHQKGPLIGQEDHVNGSNILESTDEPLSPLLEFTGALSGESYISVSFIISLTPPLLRKQRMTQNSPGQ